MTNMKFDKPEFNHELLQTPAGTFCVNMTVRKGVKWSLKVEIGDMIDMFEVGTGEWLGAAHIFDVKVLPFSALEKLAYRNIVKMHHLSKVDSYLGLHYAMRRAYDGFMHDEIVTVICFTIDSMPMDYGKRAEKESE